MVAASGLALARGLVVTQLLVILEMLPLTPTMLGLKLDMKNGLARTRSKNGLRRPSRSECITGKHGPGPSPNSSWQQE